MKNIVNRFLKGVAIGSTTYLVFLMFYYHKLVITVISVMVISGLIGLATFIFKTDLNYFVALVIHFLITFLLAITMILINHWDINWQLLWLIVVAYVIIWGVLRFQQHQDVKQINEKLEQRK